MKDSIFTYILDDAGWGSLLIKIENNILEYNISYLHDSLFEFSESAIKLLGNSTHRSVTFMDEPGELKIEFEKFNSEYLSITGKWFNDWFSWNLVASDDFIKVFQIEISLMTFSKNVFFILDSIYKEFGTKGYKEKWIEHEFPLDNYKKLKIMIYGN